MIASPTMQPRTRHIAIKYHHFREHIKKRTYLHQMDFNMVNKKQLYSQNLYPLPSLNIFLGVLGMIA
jgi:hypothetical protein